MDSETMALNRHWPSMNNLPSWAECQLMIDNEKFAQEMGREQEISQKPDELVRFIYEEEPAGDEEAKHWRERLMRLIVFLQPNLNDLAVEIVGVNKANGWNVCEPDDWFRDKYKIPAVLALIHSEVSEALEAYRKDDKENFVEELADVLIRVLDCAGGLGLNMDEEVANKIEINKGRGFRHGGKKV